MTYQTAKFAHSLKSWYNEDEPLLALLSLHPAAEIVTETEAPHINPASFQQNKTVLVAAWLVKLDTTNNLWRPIGMRQWRPLRAGRRSVYPSIANHLDAALTKAEVLNRETWTILPSLKKLMCSLTAVWGLCLCYYSLIWAKIPPNLTSFPTYTSFPKMRKGKHFFFWTVNTMEAKG